MSAPSDQLWWWLWRAGRFVAVLYVAVTVLAWWVSDRLIFQPNHGSRRAPPGEVKIKLKDGTELSAVYLPNPTARLTLWYFHGNAEDLGDVAPLLQAMRQAGYSVFAYDYPGYGRSDGSPSEKSIYPATDAALDYLRREQGVSMDRVVVYGSSVGGGPVMELVARERAAGVVLQSAFTSAYRVMTRWPLVPFDKFKNLRKIPGVGCPLLMMHGEADRVVPFHHGETLFAAATGRKTFIRVPGAGHNDLLSRMGDDYWKALRTFTEGL